MNRRAHDPYAPHEPDESYVYTEVPEGTAKAVLDWVGTDRARATEALEVEDMKGAHARKTLVADLTRILNG